MYTNYIRESLFCLLTAGFWDLSERTQTKINKVEMVIQFKVLKVIKFKCTSSLLKNIDQEILNVITNNKVSISITVLVVSVTLCDVFFK